MQAIRFVLALVFALTVSACFEAVVDEHQTASPSCPFNEVIHVVDAYYGLAGDANPECVIAAGTCPNAEHTLEIVKGLCEGKQACDVVAENSVFGDPCYGTFKNFKIEYTCECDKTIKLKQVPGVGPLYFGLYVWGSTEKIIKVEVRGQILEAIDPTWWMDMPAMAGGYWAINAAGPMKLPLSVQLTSAKGHVIIFEDIITAWHAGEVVDTKQCYELAPLPPPLCFNVGDACSPAITLRQADGVGPNYFGLYVLCATEKIAMVRIKDAVMTTWLNMPEMAGDPGPNYWAVNYLAPKSLKLPLSVQLIDVHGHKVEYDGIITAFQGQRYVFTDKCFA